MDHHSQKNDDVIELGAASVETKGPIGRKEDTGLGRNGMGLTED